MTDAKSSNPCPKCGGPIPADAAQGLCPKCVLASALTPTEPASRHTRPSDLPPVAVVAGAFPQLEIIELIGAGGMGVVYKARQPRLDRFVALKLLPESFAKDPTFAERFHREARVLARMNHPNIVTVYDFGHSNGFFYLLMEFVHGVNLRQAMRAGRFTANEALALVPKICDALQYAHDEGILHRDIKPENILLDTKGRPKIADFGIAKLVGEAAPDVTLTASSARLGTPHYMAPEQFEKPNEVDHRADIYSLGVVFYEMLTGELPIGRFAAPSSKLDLDARVDEIVFRALAKERELRQQSAGQMRTEVETVTATPSEARPSATPPKSAPPVSSSPPVPVFARITPDLKPVALLALVCYFGLLAVGILPFFAVTVSSQLAGFKQGIASIIAGGLVIGLSIAAVINMWKHRLAVTQALGLAPVTLADLRTGRITHVDQLMSLAAMGVILMLMLQVLLQIMASGFTVVAMLARMMSSSLLAAAATIIVLSLAGVLIQRFLRQEVEAAPSNAPAWISRTGWWFMGIGTLAYLPTWTTMNGPVRVLNSTTLLVVTGVSLLTLSPVWRKAALAINWLALLTTTVNLGMFLVAGLRGESAGIAPQQFLFGFLSNAGFIAGVWVLCRRDVRRAFGLATDVNGTSESLTPGSASSGAWAVQATRGRTILGGILLAIGILLPAYFSMVLIDLAQRNSDLHPRGVQLLAAVAAVGMTFAIFGLWLITRKEGPNTSSRAAAIRRGISLVQEGLFRSIARRVEPASSAAHAHCGTIWFRQDWTWGTVGSAGCRRFAGSAWHSAWVDGTQ